MNMEFHIDGIEHKTQNSALVSMGSKLPFYIEVQTSKLLNLLLDLTNKMFANENTRKKARRWLFDKTRPGFYMELTALFIWVNHKKIKCNI